jgi:Major tropism determinant N-terminal domain
MAVVTQIQVRRGTAAQWTSANPTLAAGEMGFETDTNKFKIGTGSTAWSGLTYFSALGSPVSLANGGTAATSAPAAMASLMGYTSTATASGTTTLTNTSSYYQQFTGTLNQTITLPVTSTLTTGWTFHIVNNSTGTLTVNSSGANLVYTVPTQTTVMVTCIATSTTTAADWEAGLTDFSNYTGTGGTVVTSVSPTITTPVITQGSSTPTFTTNAYTLVAGDAGQALLASNSSTAGTISIPTNASVPFAVGTQITIINVGSGLITVQAVTSGTTTVLSTGATAAAPKCRVQYAAMTLLKTATDTWYAFGDIA